jgi:hypothetical protein
MSWELAVGAPPGRKYPQTNQPTYHHHRCVKLGLTCENPRANAAEERLAEQLSVRHGWTRLLADPASLSAEQRLEIARSRPQAVEREKAKLVL